MKDMLYEVRCLKSNEDMILALAGQFKQLLKQLLKLSSKCEDQSYPHLISNTALHITYLSYDIPFTGGYDPRTC